MKGARPAWWSTGGRGGAVLLVWAMSLALSWAWSTVSVPWALRPLASHPDGVRAPWREGGRLAMDLLAAQHDALQLLGRGALLVAAVWGLVWLVLGAFYPLMGASPVAPPVGRALAEAVRRVKTTVWIELLAGLGAALSAAFGWWFVRYLGRVGEALHDARRTDLRQAAAIAGAVAFFGLVRCWRDVAMAYAMGNGRAALTASWEALGALVRRPLATVGRWLWWLGLAWLPPLGLALGVHAVEWRPEPEYLVLTALTQQLALWWGYHCRMKWFVHLGDRVVRAPTARSG